jgi:ATP-dependent protease Clp ATPase subunit
MQIIGQKEAVRPLTRLLAIFKKSKGRIKPHFILSGPSSSGKILTIDVLCHSLELPMYVINAAQLTREGVSGSSVAKELTILRNAESGPKVIFIDEFDKLLIDNKQDTISARSGVQDELLKILEGSEASVPGDYGKYLRVDMSTCLFVFSGAFDNKENITVEYLKNLGLRREFLGRVPLLYQTSALELDDMKEILFNHPLVGEYIKIFGDKDKAECLLELEGMLEQSFENNTLGARLVVKLIHQYFISGPTLPDPKEKEKALSQMESLEIDF